MQLAGGEQVGRPLSPYVSASSLVPRLEGSRTDWLTRKRQEKPETALKTMMGAHIDPQCTLPIHSRFACFFRCFRVVSASASRSRSLCYRTAERIMRARPFSAIFAHCQLTFTLITS